MYKSVRMKKVLMVANCSIGPIENLDDLRVCKVSCSIVDLTMIVPPSLVLSLQKSHLFHRLDSLPGHTYLEPSLYSQKQIWQTRILTSERQNKHDDRKVEVYPNKAVFYPHLDS